MYKSALFAMLLALSQWSFAGVNQVVTNNEAGARADSSTIINGAPPSPVVGLPSLAGSSPPPLFGQLPPPSYVLFGRLLDITSKFEDVVITGKDDLQQFTLDTKTASATFAPSPQFLRYKKASTAGCSGDDSFRVFCPDATHTLAATFKSRYSGNVRWLGTVMVSSKNGAVLIPPADKQFVWEVVRNSSTAKLGSVLIVPVPQGYGVNVGVTNEGSAIGITSTLAKIASIFIGIGPSFSTQSGTTMVTGSWSQQYLVLEEDPNGIPFAIDLVTPPDDGSAAKRDAELRREVDVARQAALLKAQESQRAAAMQNLELQRQLVALQAEKEAAKVVPVEAPPQVVAKRKVATRSSTVCPCVKKPR